MIKKVLLAFIILFLSFSFAFPETSYTFAKETAQADSPAGVQEFLTSYDVVYDVGADGVTTVTEKITLKNLTSQYYASQFKLTIGATEIFDVKASDLGGPLNTTVEKSDSSTVVTVKFNQQVVGVDKILSWTLQFRSKDFAEKIGKVWEVRSPKISGTSVGSYNLTLAVPVSFGEPTLISPAPKSQSVSSGKVFFTYDKSQIESSGVSANFGTSQLFDFDLAYHLENPNLFAAVTNIALPPDTAYQDVIFQRIEPPPLNVTVDGDGNYLAWYRLTRNEKKDIKVVGSAKLYSASKVKNPDLSEELRKKYTEGPRYWEVNHPQISTALEQILSKNLSTNTTEKAKNIFRYVVNSLKYDRTRFNEEGIERYGAVTALANPNSAVCMEFTDLFITLARSAGIPARELNGFAYTVNPALRPLSLTKDILHAWPEYWDEKKGWVMVDPTWENTTGGVDYFEKLDLNHFVFVTKGYSSEEPVPAGSYKYNGQNTSDVKVTLSDNDFLGKPQLSAEIDTSKPFFAGFPAKLKVKIKNSGNAVFPPSDFSISSGKISIHNQQIKDLGPIPSFGEANFEFEIKTNSLFESFRDEIIITLGEDKFKEEINIEPFFLFKTIPLISLVIALIMIIAYAAIFGTFFYRRRFLTKSKAKK